MRVLHGLVIGLVAVALAGRVLLEEPGSYTVTWSAILVAFIVNGGALALDVLDARWRWVAADIVVAGGAVVAVALF